LVNPGSVQCKEEEGRKRIGEEIIYLSTIFKKEEEEELPIMPGKPPCSE
jgi:hypothetical protein